MKLLGRHSSAESWQSATTERGGKKIQVVVAFKWWSLRQHLPGHTWYRLSGYHFNLCTDAYASVLLSLLNHFAENQRLEIFTQISRFFLAMFCIQNQKAVLQPKVADSETPDRKAQLRPPLCDASCLRSTSLGELSNWKE